MPGVECFMAKMPLGYTIPKPRMVAPLVEDVR